MEVLCSSGHFERLWWHEKISKADTFFFVVVEENSRKSILLMRLKIFFIKLWNLFFFILFQQTKCQMCSQPGPIWWVSLLYEVRVLNSWSLFHCHHVQLLAKCLHQIHCTNYTVFLLSVCWRETTIKFDWMPAIISPVESYHHLS